MEPQEEKRAKQWGIFSYMNFFAFNVFHLLVYWLNETSSLVVSHPDQHCLYLYTLYTVLC